ncbi:MAG: alpha/beta hydrolase [Chloroflexaceae bacterium]|nr:alpha/beta hydrolase [Chloroflexaceae bacterium]
MLANSYTTRRLLTTLTPLAHLQRAPYCGPVQSLAIPTSDGVSLDGVLLSRQRPDLLIISHGFASSQRSRGIVWLAEQLADRWDVLTFDWRGYGSSGGHATFGGDEALDFAAVLAYAREANYRSVGVIAESMGGLITLAALGAAAADATLPDRVATVGAPVDYGLTAGLRPHLIRHVAPKPWVRRFAPLLGFRMGPVNPPRPLDVVRNIRLPLMVIHGDQDTTVPVANAHHLREQVPHADLRIYEGVDHGVDTMRLQAPQRFLADLREHFSAM